MVYPSDDGPGWQAILNLTDHAEVKQGKNLSQTSQNAYGDFRLMIFDTTFAAGVEKVPCSICFVGPERRLDGEAEDYDLVGGRLLYNAFVRARHCGYVSASEVGIFRGDDSVS